VLEPLRLDMHIPPVEAELAGEIRFENAVAAGSSASAGRGGPCGVSCTPRYGTCSISPVSDRRFIMPLTGRRRDLQSICRDVAGGLRTRPGW